MLPAPKNTPKVSGPHPDPVALRVGKRPDLMRTSMSDLALKIIARTNTNPDWPDVQGAALGWAASARELASLLIQKQVAIQEHANAQCGGDHDAANFELVQNHAFKRVDQRINHTKTDMQGYEKLLRSLSEGTDHTEA